MLLKMIFGGVRSREMITLKGSPVMKTEVMLIDVDANSDTAGFLGTIWGNKGTYVEDIVTGTLVVADVTFTSKTNGRFTSVYVKVNSIRPYEEGFYFSPLEALGIEEKFDEDGKPYYVNENNKIVNLHHIRAMINEYGVPKKDDIDEHLDWYYGSIKEESSSDIYPGDTDDDLPF